MEDFKIGSDGVLRVDEVTYNYVQTKNLVPDGCFGYISGTTERNVWSHNNNVDIQGGSGNYGYRTYRSCKLMSTLGEAMLKQSMPQPIANHKYYGGCIYKTLGTEGDPIGGDTRFEWWVNDSESGKLVFCHKNVQTGGKWKKLSSIQSIPSVDSGSWIIRQFATADSNTDIWVSNHIIIDLTEAFGEGNEPTKEWCDENIIEWEKFTNFGSSWTADYKGENHWTYEMPKGNAVPKVDWLDSKPSTYPVEYYYDLDASTNFDNIVHSSKKEILRIPYYASYDRRISSPYNFINKECTSISWWSALTTVDGDLSYEDKARKHGCNLGDLRDWERKSFFFTSPTESSDYYPELYFNNFTDSFKESITSIGCVKVESNIDQYNAYNGTSITANDVNREWCDRWIDQRSHSIIHIPDHRNKDIKIDFAIKNGNNVIGDIIAKEYTDDTLFKVLGTSKDVTVSTISDGLEFGTKYWVDITVNGGKARLVVEFTEIDSSTISVFYINCYYTGDTEYDELTKVLNISCNDIEIRPEVDKIKLLPNGKIICKRLETDRSVCLYKRTTGNLTSSDWENSDTSNIPSSKKEIKKLCFAENRFMAIYDDFSIASSESGNSFDILVDPPVQLTGSYCTGICYGNDKYVIVSDSGTVLIYENNNYRVASTVENANFTSICYGDGVFLATTESGKVYYMISDSDTFVEVTNLPNSDSLNTSCYSSDLGFIVAGKGAVYRSINGIDQWTSLLSSAVQKKYDYVSSVADGRTMYIYYTTYSSSMSSQASHLGVMIVTISSSMKVQTSFSEFSNSYMGEITSTNLKSLKAVNKILLGGAYTIDFVSSKTSYTLIIYNGLITSLYKSILPGDFTVLNDVVTGKGKVLITDNTGKIKLQYAVPNISIFDKQ